MNCVVVSTDKKTGRIFCTSSWDDLSSAYWDAIHMRSEGWNAKVMTVQELDALMQNENQKRMVV